MAGNSPVTAEGFAAGLGSRALHCRELGHNWRAFTVEWDQKARCYDRRLRCPSCGTIRIQLLDSSALVLSNRYEYPKGYLAKDVKGVDRSVFRLEALHRAIQETPGTGKAS